MDDPCRDCDTLEKRDLFLRGHRHQPSCLLKDANINTLSQHVDCFNASVELMNAIFESSQDSILVWDKDYNYLYANQAAIDYVGATRDKVIGKNIRDGLGHLPDFMRLWMGRIDEVFKTGHSMRVTDAVQMGDRMVYSESVVSPICFPNGEVFSVSVVYRDVTEQKKLERELTESKQKYQELYDQAQIPLYRTRISDGKLLECNQAMANLLGYASQDECLAEYCSVSHYADPARRAELLNHLEKEGSVSGFEIEFTRRDGTQAWVEITAKQYPEQGYIQGIQVDITASKVLTKIETQILGSIMQGNGNKEIAQQLKRSVRTIEDHRAHIMRKLKAANLVELAQKAQFLNFHSAGKKKSYP